MRKEKVSEGFNISHVLLYFFDSFDVLSFEGEIKGMVNASCPVSLLVIVTHDFNHPLGVTAEYPAILYHSWFPS